MRTITIKSGMLCDGCGGNLETVEVPKDIYIFTIPFTKIEILYRIWEKEFYCQQCEQDKRDEQFRRVYEQGGRDALERLDRFAE